MIAAQNPPVLYSGVIENVFRQIANTIQLSNSWNRVRSRNTSQGSLWFCKKATMRMLPFNCVKYATMETRA